MKASTAKNASKLLRLLRDQTRVDKLVWNETEKSDIFQASFPSYSVRIGPSSKLGSATAAAIAAGLGIITNDDQPPVDFTLVIYDSNGKVDDVISVPGVLEVLQKPLTYPLPDATELNSLLQEVYESALAQVDRMGSSTGALIHELEQIE